VRELWLVLWSVGPTVEPPNHGCGLFTKFAAAAGAVYFRMAAGCRHGSLIPTSMMGVPIFLFSLKNKLKLLCVV